MWLIQWKQDSANLSVTYFFNPVNAAFAKTKKSSKFSLNFSLQYIFISKQLLPLSLSLEKLSLSHSLTGLPLKFHVSKTRRNQLTRNELDIQKDFCSEIFNLIYNCNWSLVNGRAYEWIRIAFLQSNDTEFGLSFHVKCVQCKIPGLYFQLWGQKLINTKHKRLN